MSYTYLFYQHIAFRHSCGKCHFCNTRRPSDITLADFWGWQKTDPDINRDDKGISLVLVNTEKGRKLFDMVRNDLALIPTDIEKCMQPNLAHPSAIHPKRMDFEGDFKKYGFEYVMTRYGNVGWRYKLRVLYSKVANKLKRITKRLIG